MYWGNGQKSYLVIILAFFVVKTVHKYALQGHFSHKPEGTSNVNKEHKNPILTNFDSYELIIENGSKQSNLLYTHFCQ